jgi:hypothetical protein
MLVSYYQQLVSIALLHAQAITILQDCCTWSGFLVSSTHHNWVFLLEEHKSREIRVSYRMFLQNFKLFFIRASVERRLQQCLAIHPHLTCVLHTTHHFPSPPRFHKELEEHKSREIRVSRMFLQNFKLFFLRTSVE